MFVRSLFLYLADVQTSADSRRMGVVAEDLFLPEHFAGILSVTASGREKVDEE